MTHNTPKTKKRSGSILVFALIILSLILITALGVASTTLSQRKATNISGKSTAAFQNADKGVEIFLQKIYHESSQISTLDEITDDGGSLDSFECNPVTGKLQIESGSSQFEVVAFQKNPDGSGEVIEVGNPTSGTGCATQLGDIARFKIIGEFSGAARALEVTVNDSLNRGLLAHWPFEDSAESERGFSVPGSPVAKDASVNDHIFTLCPIDNNSAAENFDLCPQTDEESDVVNAPVNPDTSAPYVLDETYMNHETQWTSGPVDESSDFGTPHSEALVFNGNSNYLVFNEQVSGESNYVELSRNKLLDIDEAIAISVWVKKENSDAGVLITNAPVPLGQEGYQLFFNDSDEINVRLGTPSGPEGTRRALYPDDNDWHHVVMQWYLESSPPRRPDIYIDGTDVSLSGGSPLRHEIEPGPDQLMVGGYYTGDDNEEFDYDDFGSSGVAAGFEGALDDLRIYNRALTSTEIKELCKKASSPWNGECAS